MPDPILYETDSGIVLLRGSDVVLSEPADGGDRDERLRKMAEGVKRKGISRLKVSSMAAKEKMEEAGIETSILTDEERDDLESRRSEILSRAGLLGGA